MDGRGGQGGQIGRRAGVNGFLTGDFPTNPTPLGGVGDPGKDAGGMWKGRT